MYLTDVALEDVPESQGSAPDEEFGSLAILLGDPQECPACPTAAAETRLNKAVVSSVNIRAFFLDQAVSQAAGRDCLKPLQS